MTVEKALRAAAAERILVLDGAMGTMIQEFKLDEAGYRGSRFDAWNREVRGNNDLLNLSQPDSIRDIHLQYFRAGADIVSTNTFSSTSIAQADYGLQEIAYELNLEGAKLVRAAAAVAQAEDGRQRFVAGALGPTNRTASISPDVGDPGFRAITFDQLRDAYAESTFYDPYNTDLVSLRGPFQKAFAEGDCAGAIAQGLAILEKNYVFVDAHFILGICHRRLGQTEPSQRHIVAAQGLMKAILATGDGKTPESAIVVISVAEEYTIMGMQGAKKLQQALISKNGHSYDLITVENKSGGKEQIYFNVDRVMRWSAEKLVPKK